MPQTLKLALGPNQYYWPRQAMLDFYASIVDSPVDIVYLGETVCARRHELRMDDWLEIGQVMADAGKEVVISTLPLIESASDLKALRKLTDQAGFRIEANDMAAVNQLDQAGIEGWIAGPTLNVFTPQTLGWLQDMGARRWVAPPEMSRADLTALVRACPRPPQVEVTAYGRLPLAYSARCFTARHFNLQKDTCEFRCLQFADGIRLHTREGEPFLTLNGIQTQSAQVHNLLADLPGVADAGVGILRILPQGEHTADIITLFDETRRQVLDPQLAFEHSHAYMTDAPCNGFWHGRAGVEQYVAPQSIAA